jgi:mono/diheme cytochrome c family protein
MSALFLVRLLRRGRICDRRNYFFLARWASAAFLSGASVAAQELPSTTSSLSQGSGFDEQGGKVIYLKICAACHQKDAKGAVGAASYPALAKNENVASAEYMENVLLAGLSGMPPLGRMMSDEQVADVINYVRSHFGNSYSDEVSAAEIAAARSLGRPNH